MKQPFKLFIDAKELIERDWAAYTAYSRVVRGMKVTEYIQRKTVISAMRRAIELSLGGYSFSDNELNEFLEETISDAEKKGVAK